MQVLLKTAQLDREDLWLLLGLLGGAPPDWAGPRLSDFHDDLAFELCQAVKAEMERRKAPDAEPASDLTLDLPIGGLDSTTEQVRAALAPVTRWTAARALSLFTEPDLRPLAATLADLGESLVLEYERRAGSDAALESFCESGGDVV